MDLSGSLKLESNCLNGKKKYEIFADCEDDGHNVMKHSDLITFSIFAIHALDLFVRNILLQILFIST